jgi:uncharacterized protein
MQTIVKAISEELAARSSQVEAAIELLDGGATVPFIARYRKEATGGLDDAQLRLLEQRLGYLRELEDRRQVILNSLEEQGKLTDDLRAAVLAADSKQRLEDLYLPYRPKRRTKAQIAREAGLEPLAEALLAHPDLSPEAQAAAFVRPEQGVADAAAALEGARQILMERAAEDPELAGALREALWQRGMLKSRVLPGQESAGAKFSDYFEHAEPIGRIPSHRALALFRGRNQGVLSLELTLGDEPDADAPLRARVAAHLGIADRGRPGDAWLMETARKAWRIKLLTRLDLDLKGRLLEAAEAEAIRVFATNLRALLMAAPAGRLPTMGLDPGLRTGVKVAVVDGTGRVVATDSVFPHVPRNQWDAAIATLAELCRVHGVKLISIGNGTASRETDRLVRDLAKRHPELGLTAVMVSEAGASVYSASEYASKELPQLDVSLRGAVSIARRLQDPLAELVKIDPKSIGVGQYQHDVNQTGLARSLDGVVEDCVNAVGVDLTTASAPLLARVSGISATLAENLVRHRDEHGPFRSRAELLEVPRLGEKAFQQCAGFLRIPDGAEPLDASAVHPEAYAVVRRIVAHTGRLVAALIGDRKTLHGLSAEAFADAVFGAPTVRDILVELEKPGRDPRPVFETAALKDGIEQPEDLEPGMVLEGTVTNVTNFGAFVDIGVHQDGLVHISQLADRFVEDPHKVVRSGQVVKVKVLAVDLARRRIGLSMRLDAPIEAASTTEHRKPEGNRAPGQKPDAGSRKHRRRGADSQDRAEPASQGTLAAAFEAARRR